MDVVLVAVVSSCFATPRFPGRTATPFRTLLESRDVPMRESNFPLLHVIRIELDRLLACDAYYGFGEVERTGIVCNEFLRMSTGMAGQGVG